VSREWPAARGKQLPFDVGCEKGPCALCDVGRGELHLRAEAGSVSVDIEQVDLLFGSDAIGSKGAVQEAHGPDLVAE
jgi:hypothetical protein